MNLLLAPMSFWVKRVQMVPIMAGLALKQLDGVRVSLGSDGNSVTVLRCDSAQGTP